MLSRRGKGTQKPTGAAAILYALFVMFICSGILLLLLSLMVFYLDLSANIAGNSIYAIYAIASFLGGFLIGKLKKEKKFLWGILAGVVYFVLILIASLVHNGGAVEDVVHMLIALLLCIAPAMAGGMIS